MGAITPPEVMAYQRAAYTALGLGDVKEARRLIDWADAAADRCRDMPPAYRSAITGLRALIARCEAQVKAGRRASAPVEPEDPAVEAFEWRLWEREDIARAARNRSTPKAFTPAQRRGRRRTGQYL